jgi:flagellar biosynthesis/type III secretory pathway protein FliH
VSKELHPFLLFTPQPTRPLGAALPALATPEVTSPWTPRKVEDAAPPVILPSPEELASAVEEARAQARAEGLEETAALRGQLAAALEDLARARAAIVAPAAELIAEVCGCVIEGWLASEDRARLFAPIVTSWLAASDQAAVVRVHPDDVAALAPLVAGSALTVTADPSLAPGALAIQGATLEVAHDWRARMPELRTAIAAALTPEADAAGADA